MVYNRLEHWKPFLILSLLFETVKVGLWRSEIIMAYYLFIFICWRSTSYYYDFTHVRHFRWHALWYITTNLFRRSISNLGFIINVLRPIAVFVFVNYVFFLQLICLNFFCDLLFVTMQKNTKKMCFNIMFLILKIRKSLGVCLVYKYKFSIF